MNPNVKIIEEKVLSNNWYVLKKITFDYKNKSGEWQTQAREAYDRGNGATILLYNKEYQTVVLTEQFRMPTYINGNETGMLIEACAGLLDKDNPEDCIRRETEEEMRYAGTIGSNPSGPFLDYRGYVTTSQDPRRQMESAERFITTYVDRFTALLPAYGEPVFLENDVAKRRETLLMLLGQYRQLGDAYRQLSMVTPEDS